MRTLPSNNESGCINKTLKESLEESLLFLWSNSDTFFCLIDDSSFSSTKSD